MGSVVRGKYRVEAFLATGTMANVYAATHRNGARVALKILHPQLAEDPSLCERFKREGYFANSIGHPGIVRAIDDDVTEDGCPFMVMELLEGETLDERRRRKGGKLPLSWVLPVADSLLDILAAAHARDVVHRDLKPDNVFVTKSGDVKVLDFGVARWNDGKSSSDMTGVGMVLGTPAYMPPEQALGRREDVDARSDLWAVGATLFVVLSGESVHVGGDAKAKLIATARTAARPLHEAAPDVPRAVAAVIDRALAFHKQERWPDAEAMREALRWARMSLEERRSETVAASSDVVLEPIPPPVPTRRTMDDEVTVARARPQEEAPISSAASSKDFLTSAPPITLRDAPRSTATDPASAGPVFSLHGDPVFSLRREKEAPPSTERLPDRAASSGIPTPQAGSANEAIPHAYAMPTYDPAEALTADMPVSSHGSERSIEVNLSFTMPMNAVVMPAADNAPPRPAAGEPPRAFPAPLPYAATQPALLVGTTLPLADSAPPAGFAQMATAPSLRVQAEVASRSSLPPDGPGPVLSQLVKPRAGLARILVPIALGLVALAAVLVVMRMRAASARAAASASAKEANAPPTATSHPSNPPSAAAPATSVPAAGATPVASLPEAKPKADANANANAKGAASAPTPEIVKKARAKPRKKPAQPKPAEPAPEPAAAAAATEATPAAAPPPVDTIPKDSLPSKDPEPKPAPVTPPAPAETPAP